MDAKRLNQLEDLALEDLEWEDWNKYVLELIAEVRRLTRERDAYKRAKEENDERFLCERDAARAEVELLKKKCEALKRSGTKCRGMMKCLSLGRQALLSELDNLKVEHAGCGDALGHLAVAVQQRDAALLEVERLKKEAYEDENELIRTMGERDRALNLLTQERAACVEAQTQGARWALEWASRIVLQRSGWKDSIDISSGWNLSDVIDEIDPAEIVKKGREDGTEG
jgi:chromosome segregation ATPase